MENFLKQKGKEGIDFDIENQREKELLGDHFYLHVGWNALKGKTKIKPWKDWKTEDFIEYHAKVVQALRKLGHEFKPKKDCDLDQLSEKFLSKALVPSDIPTLLKPGIKAIQPEAVVRQRRKKKIKKTEKALVPSDIPTLIQPGATIMRPAKILVEPHGEWAISGKKKAFLSAKSYEQYLNMPVYLVQGDQCLGLIEIKDPKEITLKEFKETQKLHLVSEEERKKWWPEAKKLYLYPIEVIQRFRPFRKIYRPKGAQTWLNAVTFLEDLPPLKFENIKDLNDEELIETHDLLHKYWIQEKRGYSKEDLINLHALIISEMRKRDIIHEDVDELDEETKNLLSQIKKERNLEIKFFGTKGLIEESNPDHKFHTAILFTFQGKKLLVDWGEINQGTLSELQPDYILNSHAHPDHIGGLSDMEVYISEKTEMVLPNLYKDFNITYHTYKSYETFNLNPFRITAIPVYHSIKAPMHIFLIEAGGLRILVGTDVLSWKKGDQDKYLKNLDLAIIDGSSLTKDLIRAKDGEPFGHASIQTQLKNWYKPENVKEIIITHLGKELVESNENDLIERISRMTSIPFRIAKDNDVFQFKTKVLELEDVLAPVYPSGIQLGRPIYLKEVLPFIRSFYPHRVFAWIVGGLANWGRTRGDIDILWRADPEMPNYFKKILEFRFGRQFLNPEIATRIQHHWDVFHGPFTNAIPIYALKVERINPGNIVIQASEEVIEPQVIEMEWDEKREGFIPPDFQYYLEKQRVRSLEIKREAEESKKKDEVKPFRYFLPLKPVRGYFPEERQTIETFLNLFKDEDFPVYASKKFDGVSVEVHRVGNRVEIISEDGEHNEDRFVKTLEEAKIITDKNYVLMAECEIWEKGKHQPREVAAGFLHSKGKPDDSKVVLNVFDLVYFDDRDIHNEPFEKRLEILEKEFKFKQSTDKIPNLEFKFNLVPHYLTRNKNELRRLTERLRKLPGSEGNVAKIHNFKYRLDGLRSGMIKFHNSSTVYAIVTKVKETKVKGIFNYFFGIKENQIEAKDLIQIGNTFYHQSGKTFSTSLKFQVGDKIEIECETFNLEKHPDGKYRVSLWAPRVIGKTNKPVDDIWNASKRAINNLSFMFKEIRKEGTIYFQNELPVIEKAYLFEKFRDIRDYKPEEHTDAQLRDDLRLAMAYFSSLKGGKKMKFSEKELIDFGKKLMKELLRRKRKNEGIYSAKPENMKPNAREFWEKITEDLEKEEKKFLMKADAYMIYPKEGKTVHYVIQMHFRGRSHHLDLRIEMNDYLIGWTITAQMKGEPKEPILTLEQAKKLDLNKISKIDWKKGVPKLRPGIKPGFKPKYAELSAVRKSPEPKGWLYVEGVTPRGTVGATKEYPGVFLIVDKGIVEFGAQKPYFHEYFFSGGKLKGRWVFRQLRPAEFKGPKELAEKLIPPERETSYREEAPFFLMKPVDETPYVISDKAVESNWIPPYGISALPKKVKQQIPSQFQYWKIKDEKKRIEMRNALVEAKLKIELSEVDSAKVYARALYRFILAKIPYNTIWDPMPEAEKRKIISNLVNQFLKEHPPKSEWIADIEAWLSSHEGNIYERTLEAFKLHKFEKQGRVKFVLQWHYWRGQKVIRIGTPTTQHWDLRFDIKTPSDNYLHYVLDNNPLKVSETTALYKECKYKEWMDFEGYIPPKNEREKMTEAELKKFPPGLEEANPTLDTPAFIELVDKGEAIVFEDAENFKKFQFEGKALKGLWIFVREGTSAFWIMKKSELPSPRT